uniref:Uncharacterized protein n=1 Tax=Arundo donax TaxID=35708 RepID=A0A0A9HKB5_ARUDO
MNAHSHTLSSCLCLACRAQQY